MLHCRLCLVLLIVTSVTGVFAKGVAYGAPDARVSLKLEWPKQPNAHTYEVQISSDPKFANAQALDRITHVPSVTLALEPGHYFYRFRELREDAAAFWSATLEVLARPAEPTPVVEKKIDYQAGMPVTLRWKGVPGFEEYLVVLSQGSKEISRKFVTGTSVDIENLEPGSYSWKVATYLKLPQGSESKSESKSEPYLLSRWTPEVSFELKSLETDPSFKTLFPEGKIRYSGELLSFSWTAFKNCNEYLIEVQSSATPSKRDQVIAHVSSNDTYTKQAGRIFLPGKYHWQVMARDPVSKEVVAITSGDFEITAALDRASGYGYLSAGFMAGNYNYSSATTSYATAISPSTSGPNISGAYFFLDTFGIEASYAYRSFSLQEQTLGITDISLGGIYHHRFSEGSRWWYSLGVRGDRSLIPEVLANSGTTDSVNSLQRWQLIPHMGVSYKLDSKTLLFTRFEWLKTMSASGGVYPMTSTPTQTFAYSVHGGLQGAWFWPWGILLDASLTKDNYSYSIANDTVSAQLSEMEFRFGLFYEF